jgi:serine/threonine-protein kinase
MNTPKTIGRYEVLDELGHGAMGSVFRARDPAMDRIVALKTILAVALASEQGGEYRQRFYREARAAGALAHPGIVPVFDVGEHEGVPYLVMEYVNGRTLADAMRKGERISLERLCEIGEQIADALGYAHRNGVIHRDIKPANILLTSRETYGHERPRITDFGVAKLAAGEITTTGQLLGTPAFMPPEQFTGAPIDGRTDLFSLGVILYWMATGDQPFPGETMTTVSYKIVHTEPIPPGKLNPAIPAALDRAILKCLAKNPADRFQTGEELAQALAEVRTGVKAPGMQTVIPLVEGGGGESEETVDASPGLTPMPAAASVMTATVKLAPQAAPAAAPKKRGSLIVAAVAVAVLVAAAGGYLILHRIRPAPQQSVQVASQPTAPATSEAAQTPQAPAPAVASDATPLATKKAAGVAASAAPHARTAGVAFDPKALDPKQNARLKLDLGRLPGALAFTIEMNGKTYFKGTAGSKSDYDNLFVPPGVHEFRVTVSGGGVQKVSNIVSADFIAKKRMSLKVELRPEAKGGSAALNPAAQVVATLRADRFFL